jgi:hypothetical protein
MLGKLRFSSSEVLAKRNAPLILLSYIVVFSFGLMVQFQSTLPNFNVETVTKHELHKPSSDSGNVYIKKSQENMRRSRLRLDYRHLERLSPLAQAIEAMQSNCDFKKMGISEQRACCGLGSDIHTYSVSLCYGLQLKNVRVRTLGYWHWRDEKHCQVYDSGIKDPWKSPLKCYFPESENLCPEDDAQFGELELQDPERSFNMTYPGGGIAMDVCPDVIENAGSVSVVRAATTEFLFTRVADIVQKEGQRQLEAVFGINRTHGEVPSNLITVHIRWGDKRFEAGLLPIEPYIDAVRTIVESRRQAKGKNESWSAEEDEVSIFLSTEDPDAHQQFLASKPDHWNVYVDQYYVENLPYRTRDGNEYNNHINNLREAGAQMGLVALGSMLVAMEANDFVLTTTSNWSRLMNEIRKNLINPRCGDCTQMIDLLSFEYR